MSWISLENYPTTHLGRMPDNLPSTHNKQLILERFIGQRSDICNALEFESSTESLIFPLNRAIVQKKIRMDDCDRVTSTGLDIEKIGCFKYKGGLCIVGEAECRETMAKVQISSLQDLTSDRSKTTKESQLNKFEYSMHLSGVIAVDISHEQEYCASLGSNNDGNLSVVDLINKKAFAKKPAQDVSVGCATMMKFANFSNIIATGGVRTFRIWEIDKIGARLDYREVSQNKHIGEITGLEFSDDDKFVFLSTIKGEIIVVDVERMVIRQIIGYLAGKQLKKITCLKLLPNFSDTMKIGDDPVEMQKDTLALCDVDGGIKIIEIPRSNIDDKIIKQLVQLKIPNGYVRSLCKVDKREIAIISDKGLLASINIQDPSLSGLNVVHESFIQSITSLRFAEDTDKLFLASGGSRICIFQSSTMTLKTIIEIKSLECLSSIIIGGGSIILSGWSDGSIRAFGPESGTPYFQISNAHRGEVTALAILRETSTIVSAGSEGQLRFWDSSLSSMENNCIPALRNCINAHRSSIVSIEVNDVGKQCLTASADGSCTIWDIKSLVALKVLFINSAFTCALYEPLTHAQLLTASCDGIIRFWNADKGTMIREIGGLNLKCQSENEGEQTNGASKKSVNRQIRSINSLVFIEDPHATDTIKNYIDDGTKIEETFREQCFAFGSGGDRKLKICSYENAECLVESSEHGDEITALACSPDGNKFLSGTKDGSIYLWSLENTTIDC